MNIAATLLPDAEVARFVCSDAGDSATIRFVNVGDCIRRAKIFPQPIARRVAARMMMVAAFRNARASQPRPLSTSHFAIVVAKQLKAAAGLSLESAIPFSCVA